MRTYNQSDNLCLQDSSLRERELEILTVYFDIEINLNKEEKIIYLKQILTVPLDIEMNLKKEKKIYLFEILTVYFDIEINLNNEKKII